MEERQHAGFYAKFLGSFSLEFQGKRIFITKKLSQKHVQLLLILLKAGNQGISRRKLVECLEWEYDTREKKLNNLRRQACKLRKMINESGFPSGEYVRISADKYYFSMEYEIQSDVGRIDRWYKRLKETTEEEEQIGLLRKICGLYEGEFLRGLFAEEWVILESANYQALYFECLRKLCDRLKEQKEYTELLKLSTKAGEIYPYDGWQALQIECLMAKNRYPEALSVYKRVKAVFSEEMNMAPFKDMMEQYKELDRQAADGRINLAKIQDKLSEEGSARREAYQCSCLSFMDISNILLRSAERMKIRLSLLLCTLYRTEQAEKDEEVDPSQREKFRKTLARVIDINDIYTQYSRNQYLVLLTEKEEDQQKAMIRRLEQEWEAIRSTGDPLVKWEAGSLETAGIKEAAV